MKKKWLGFGLVVVAVAERLWFDLGPNVELVMLTSVLGSMYLGRKWGAGIVLASLMISDYFIGNGLILVFTWSGLGLIGWGGRSLLNWRGIKRVMVGGGYGLLSAWFFYVYTNFGVWLIGDWYPKTVEGLLRCYAMGLPFFKVHAVSSGLLLSGGVLVIELLKYLVKPKDLGTRCKAETVPQL
jgi:hypothetical protein